MSAMGRPKGEYRSAQHEGSPVGRPRTESLGGEAAAQGAGPVAAAARRAERAR